MIRKPIWPYLVVGLFSFVIFQSFYHYYQLSTAAVPFMGMLRLRWLLEHWERFSFGLFFDSGALYAGLIGFGLPMLVYASMDKNLYRQGEEQGSARFATLKEMRRFEDGKSVV